MSEAPEKKRGLLRRALDWLLWDGEDDLDEVERPVSRTEDGRLVERSEGGEPLQDEAVEDVPSAESGAVAALHRGAESGFEASAQPSGALELEPREDDFAVDAAEAEPLSRASDRACVAAVPTVAELMASIEWD